MLTTLLLSTALTGPAHAGDALSRDDYESRHAMQDYLSSPKRAAIDACLAAWGEHPFTTDDSKRFRVVESSVRVMGFGNELVDHDQTSYPQLILIEPTVSVMTKTTYTLQNDNGWYCFDTTVTVLGKGVVQLACDAHMADARAGVSVVGDTSGNKKGVTVVGKTEVRRSGCD